MAIEKFDYRIGDYNVPFDWREIFGNDHPVEVELGHGTGRFLLDMSTRFPERNFVGIEKGMKWHNLVNKRIKKRHLTNVRAIRADINDVVILMIPPGSVENYYIQFPDPWPKTAHTGRRLFQPIFCRNLKYGLVSGGCVHIITDVEIYYREIVEMMDQFSKLRQIEVLPEEYKRIMTNYEEKALRQNGQIHYISYRKD